MNTRHEQPEHRSLPARPIAPAPPDVPAQAPYEVARRDLSLGDYLRVLYRRRYTALASFALVLTGVLVYGFVIPEQRAYEAQVQILIEADNANVVDFREVMGQAPAADYYETQYRILRSRTLAAKTLERLDKQSGAPAAPEPAAAERPAARGALARVRGVLGSALRFFRPEAPAAPVTGENARQTRRINSLLNALSVTPVEGSRLVVVKFRSLNPTEAARVVNTLAAIYIEQNIEDRLVASQTASDWLTQQLGEQRKQVEQSEAALQRYQEQNDGLQEAQSMVAQRLSELNNAATRARTARITKETIAQQVEAARNDPEQLETIPAILSHPLVQKLRSEVSDLRQQVAQLGRKLGADHPEMTRQRTALQSAEGRLRAEIRNVVATLNNDFLTAQDEERRLLTALETQRAQALVLSRKSIEYNVLEREAASHRSIYERLLQRSHETGISRELRTSNFRIVDEAEVPLNPMPSAKSRHMVLGLLVGLVLAVCVAFVRDHMDPRITMPDDVRTALGLSYVGLIPKVRRKLLGNGDTPLIGQTVPPVFGEAIRDVRTRVVMGPAQPLQSVMVASATSGEGKTMIAANLALSLAQLGSRVLLVDVDLRRPRLHRVFNVAQSPGLSDLLTRAATVTDTVQQITAAGPLWVLPAGRPPVNPADLLGSAPFGEFLKTLPDWFDYVVLDVPPVLAVADASIVAPMVSGVLLVISADRTVKIAARGALDRLESAGAVLIGGVLNRADLERDRHAYEPYYSGAYADYAYTGALAGSREQQTEGVVVDERRR